MKASVRGEALRPQAKMAKGPRKVMKGVQTMYRESEAQTRPWTPPYTVLSSETPEVLYLACLTWENGLPVQKYGAEVIDRLRKHRAWDQYIEIIGKPENVGLLKRIINDIQLEAFSAKEQEVELINEIRLKLAYKELSEQRDIVLEKMASRIQCRNKAHMEQRDHQLRLIQKAKDKELYLLTFKEKRWKKRSIVSDYTDPSSDLYAPDPKKGLQPRNVHLRLCKEAKLAEDVDITSALNQFVKTSLQDTNIRLEKPRKVHCCIGVINWTVEDFQREIHMLQELKEEIDNPLKKPEKPMEKGMEQSDFSFTEEILEPIYQACLLLQKVLRGRAIQRVIQEGRIRNQNLIEEVLRTKPRLPLDHMTHLVEQQLASVAIRKYTIGCLKMEKVMGISNQIEGESLGFLLDFASKELLRLQDEARLHVRALEAERKRWEREAAEGGKRQVHERRLRQLDEAYKQVIKVYHQEVEKYLKDLVGFTLTEFADRTALEDIKKIAQQMDEELLEVNNEEERVEIRQQLLNQTLLPDEIKEKARQQIQKRQRKYKDHAKKLIFADLEDSEDADSESDMQIKPPEPNIDYGWEEAIELELEEAIKKKIIAEKERDEIISEIMKDIYDEFSVQADYVDYVQSFYLEFLHPIVTRIDAYGTALYIIDRILDCVQCVYDERACEGYEANLTELEGEFDTSPDETDDETV